MNKIMQTGMRKFMAEMLGTLVLVLVSKGAAIALASDPLSTGSVKSLPGALSGGFGVMMGILITGGVSGGHINPCVSVAMACGGRLAWRELPFYLVGQIIGAGLGAITVLLCYIDTIDSKVSATVLGSSLGLAETATPAILDQFVATFLLLLCILSVVEQGHEPGGLLVGLSVAGIGLGYGSNAGAAMNPAVDFVPRIIGNIWSLDFADMGESWFWCIPLLVPFAGALAALLVYRFVVGMADASPAQTDANNTSLEQDLKL